MKTKRLPPKSYTTPQTFIVESLSFDDEKQGRLDGRLLYDVLRLYGKDPAYYYFRTEKELIELSDRFRATGYRYLHISCHGNDTQFKLTLDEIPFVTFSQVFREKLDNRRLFISGCDLGNDQLANALFSTNKGMYSIIAPNRPIFFQQSAPFWSAFYYRMNAYTGKEMKKPWITLELDGLSRLFEVKMSYYWKNTSTKGVDHANFPSA